MGAICGLISSGEAGDSLAPVLASLHAYGAGSRAWQAGGVALGVRCGTEATSVELPRMNDAAGVAVAADCRLDNRAELCDALGIRTAEHSKHTNSELIGKAWLRWREECPTQMLGDYAFAVWDARRRTLFCARDPVGVRPLYYALTPIRFVFASAVEAVLAAPFVSNELNDATIAAWLTHVSLTSGTHTFFNAVRKLPPGHALAVTCGSRVGAKLQRHWRPEQTPKAAPASDDDYAEEFRHLYREAVKARLPTAGHVGTHLSGGLDSSSVTVLAARELAVQGQAPPLAFSWLPDAGRTSIGAVQGLEYRFVQAVCEQERLQVSHCAASTNDLVAVLSRDAAFPGVHVHLNEEVVQRRAAAQGVTVLLSGWGGDEGLSFDGRGGNAQLLLSGRWRRLLANRGADETALEFLADVLLRLARPDLPDRLRRLLRGEEPPHRRWLVDAAFARRTKPLAQPAQRFIGMRRTQLWLLQTGHLAERMEGWAASGARRGIDYCYPLLDRRLLEFALGLPLEQFQRGRSKRWLMRHALAPLLPPQIRRHDDKEDPARFQALKQAFAHALPVVRRMLEQRAHPPARAGYIDMPRLLQRLHADPFRVRTQMAPVRVALQFLDF